MPGIVGWVSAISSDVVSALAAASYPALTDGAILLGGQHVFEQSSPPRVVFTPTSSSFGPPNPASSWTSGSASERSLQLQQRPIASEEVVFEVRCWGGTDDDPNNAYEVTQALYQQVMRSVDSLARGCYSVANGTWTDATHLSKQGREFVFSITLSTPVLDILLPFAPSNVVPSITDGLRTVDDNSGPGCE